MFVIGFSIIFLAAVLEASFATPSLINFRAIGVATILASVAPANITGTILISPS